MAQKIRVKRGLKKDLKILDHAEIGFITDENNLAIGNNGKNVFIEGDKVGDTLTTFRRDLDSTWLLCNGTKFSAETYPDLSALLPIINPGNTWTSNNQDSVTFNDVIYANGYWVAVGDSGNLYYKSGNNPAGAWTLNAQGSSHFYSVTYGNGYWVAVGNQGTLYYKSGAPSGAWTANARGAAYNLQSIVYEDGYFVAVGTNGAIYYNSGNPSGTWTFNRQVVGTSDYPDFQSVTYGNGYWVAVGKIIISGGYSYSTLWYKSGAPSGTWTDYGARTQNLVFNSVIYNGSYFVAVGKSGTIRYSTNATSWSVNTQGTGEFKDVAYFDGYMVAVGTSGIYYKAGTNPSGAWNVGQFYIALNSLYYFNEFWVAVGSGGALRYIEIGNLTPIISIGGYTYIKAKL